MSGSLSIHKPASNGITSDSVFDFREYIKYSLPLSRGWCWVLKVASKIWVLKYTESTVLSHVPKWQCCRLSFVWWMCEINLAKLLSQVWVHFLSALASLLTDHKCLVYQFAPSTSMSRQFVSILLIFLQLIQVLPSWTGDHPRKDLKLWKTPTLFCLPARNVSLNAFSSVSFHVVGPRDCFCVRCYHPGSLSVAPAEIRDSNILL